MNAPVKTWGQATVGAPGLRSAETRGMLLGLAGVAIFSLTLPFTRMAVAAFDASFVALGRALVAALLAGLWLLWQRARCRRARPCRSWPWCRSAA